MEKVNIVDRIKAKRKVSDVWFIVLVFVFLLFVVAVVYWNYKTQGRYIFPPIGADKGAALGQLGDYFGGILNPLFSAATVLFVFGTYLHQKRALDLAKREHKINLLLNEFRYVYGGLFESISTSGLDVGNALYREVAREAQERGFSVLGSQVNPYYFTYGRLYQYFARTEPDNRKIWIKYLSGQIGNDFSCLNRMVVLCMMAKSIKLLAIDILDLVDDQLSLKLSIEQQVRQMEEIFDSLGIDYLLTADSDVNIKWCD